MTNFTHAKLSLSFGEKESTSYKCNAMFVKRWPQPFDHIVYIEINVKVFKVRTQEPILMRIDHGEREREKERYAKGDNCTNDKIDSDIIT